MKIGYFGDGEWAHRAFEKIVADDTLEIAFVVVRYRNPDELLMKMAREHQIPVELCANINAEEFVDKVKYYQPDLFVSMSFDQIFKKQMIELPPLKTINCHAGRLPFYRGRNVLNWVLINDEKEFGITVHYVDEGIDTGDIILQRTYPVTDEDDYKSLLERVYPECAKLLYDALKMIQQGEVKTVCQKEIDPVGMYCGIRKSGDEVTDWNQTSRELFNFIRALCLPGPRAVSWLNGSKIYINKARMVAGAHVYKNIPGQIIGRTGAGFLVKTKDTMLEITEYSYDGKIKIGDRLTEDE